MRVRHTHILFLVMFPLAMTGQNVMAGKVYQWSDEEGVVHFSDVAPDNTASGSIREINIDIASNENTDPDEYSIINQLDRMLERRRQETEERLAIKRLQIEEMRAERESQQTVTVGSTQYEPYYYYGYTYPYVYYQRRRYYKQPGYHTFPPGNIHHGWLSTDRPQSASHYSRVGVRF